MNMILSKELMSLAAAFWWEMHPNTGDEVIVGGDVLGVLGHPPGTLTSQAKWIPIIHATDRGLYASKLLRASKGESVTMRVRFRHADGDYRKMLVRMRGVPVINSPLEGDGNVYMICGVCQSISDVLALEAEAFSRQEDLAQVASTLSHDFRAPARHMSGCAQRIRDCIDELKSNIESGCIDPGNLGEWMDSIDKWSLLAIDSGDRMGRMIHHVLDFSKAGSAKIDPEPVSVEDVLEEVLQVENSGKALKDHAKVIYHDLPRVTCDRTLLFMLLSNLVSNAIKFSVVPGKEVKPVEIFGKNLREDPSMATVVVRDYGCGIAKTHQKDIFDMGFRTHHEKDYPGFGYGLAIVRRILVRCGGELDLRSSLGAGSDFILRLPAAH